jgi:hypothetical protein
VSLSHRPRRFGFEDAAGDDLRDLWNGSISKGGNSVHDSGRPINHSTNTGLG